MFALGGVFFIHHRERHKDTEEKSRESVSPLISHINKIPSPFQKIMLQELRLPKLYSDSPIKIEFVGRFIMKRFLFAITCVVLLIAGVFLSGKRALFLWSAEKATGTIASITGSNTTCGRKSSKRDCTQFHAQVAYTSKNGENHTLGISAGSQDGHNAPIQYAKAKIGGLIEVLYDPSNPSVAYDNSFMSIWFAPLASFAGAIFCIFPAIRRR